MPEGMNSSCRATDQAVRDDGNPDREIEEGTTVHRRFAVAAAIASVVGSGPAGCSSAQDCACEQFTADTQAAGRGPVSPARRRAWTSNAPAAKARAART